MDTLDLEKRLRAQHEHGIFDTPYPVVSYGEAAEALAAQHKEIERLRAFAEAAIRYAGNSCDDYLAQKAREALEEIDNADVHE